MMNFKKPHHLLIGALIGAVGYEMWYRKQPKRPPAS